MWFLRSMTLLRHAFKRGYCLFAPLDHVTGIEKKELLAHLGGDCDPFHIIAIKKGPGTRERPNLIPSANPHRLVVCICSKHQNHGETMCLHAGCPKRCGCGYWFVLCPVAPLVDDH